jgi:hypothetical protein
MSQLTHQLVRLDTDEQGNLYGVCRVLATGTEFTARLGMIPGAGNTIVCMPESISASETPVIETAPGDDPEAINAAANAAEERARIERTAEARGQDPASANAADLFPQGSPPTATAPGAEPVPVPVGVTIPGDPADAVLDSQGGDGGAGS